MENKKFILSDNTKTDDPSTRCLLHQIMIPGDPNGTFGGWVEREENLSQQGASWIEPYAKVMGQATVSDDASIKDQAIVKGKATIKDKATIMGAAVIDGEATIEENATIANSAFISENAKIRGHATVCGIVIGHATVEGKVTVSCGACIDGNAYVGGETHVADGAHISENAEVLLSEHILVINHFGTNSKNITFFRNSDGGISFHYLQYTGNIGEFIDKIASECEGDRILAELAVQMAEKSIPKISTRNLL